MEPPMRKVWWGKEGPTTAEMETGTLVTGKGRLTRMPQCTGARQGFLEHGRVSFITWLRGFRKLFCPGQILTVTSRVTRCKSQLFIKFSETQSLVSQYLTPTGVPKWQTLLEVQGASWLWRGAGPLCSSSVHGQSLRETNLCGHQGQKQHPKRAERTWSPPTQHAEHILTPHTPQHGEGALYNRLILDFSSAFMLRSLKWYNFT